MCGIIGILGQLDAAPRILDALKRAEQERNLGQAPTLNSVYVASTEAANRDYWRWLPPVLMINAVIMTYIAVSWLGREQPVVTAI